MCNNELYITPVGGLDIHVCCMFKNHYTTYFIKTICFVAPHVYRYTHIRGIASPTADHNLHLPLVLFEHVDRGARHQVAFRGESRLERNVDAARNCAPLVPWTG